MNEPWREWVDARRKTSFGTWGVVTTTVVAAIVGGALLGYVLVRWQINIQPTVVEEESAGPARYSTEEKLKILENLNTQKPRQSSDQKQAVIEKVNASAVHEDTTASTTEEKLKILRSVRTQ
jgi:hypothetical protein